LQKLDKDKEQARLELEMQRRRERIEMWRQEKKKKEVSFNFLCFIPWLTKLTMQISTKFYEKVIKQSRIKHHSFFALIRFAF
jgi:hypothetical protein